MSAIARGVDAALEATVVGSFSRIGYEVRSRLEHWQAPGNDLAGRTVLVTGATSGIGLAAASRFASLGAAVRFLARDDERARVALAQIVEAGGPAADVSYALADVSDFTALREFVDGFLLANPDLDVLVHNAGALNRDFHRAPDGTELTLAAHLLGPFLLTGLLLPALRRGAPGRVITVSSGGMYTQRLDLGRLEMEPGDYDGTVAYARAKRAQVVLNREWARRVPRREVVFHAMHPGWADTPGVRSSLPAFHRMMGPLLRTPDQGADTAVWLATAGDALESSGTFWHDRRPRGEHRVPWTCGGSTGPDLWDLCAARTGWQLPSATG
ncbi:MAG TPA: SDR family NAD(P)-dependent oxidoreductase [Acidimicrobiales bacterium]|nr:SDR family NAD(P)-dependent oxidoreductase [Acidimicrobiales bacterium]